MSVAAISVVTYIAIQKMQLKKKADELRKGQGVLWKSKGSGNQYLLRKREDLGEKHSSQGVISGLTMFRDGEIKGQFWLKGDGNVYYVWDKERKQGILKNKQDQKYLAALMSKV